MATVITGEDLRLFFVNPSWGEHGTSPVEIGAIKVSVSFSADYANDSSFTKSRIKPQKRSGTISMSVPLTLANFEFVNAMRYRKVRLLSGLRYTSLAWNISALSAAKSLTL